MRPRASIPVLMAVSVALCAGVALAQTSSPAPVNIPLTVPAGAPLSIELTKNLPIKTVGEHVQGMVTRPVYVFDKKVIPAGSKVIGRIAQIQSLSRKRRMLAIANGNFTPLRKPRLEFDTLILPDGSRFALKTTVSQGTPSLVRLRAGGKKSKSRVRGKIRQARQQLKAQERQAIDIIKAPGKVKRLEHALEAQLPYHKQQISKGTHFVAVLQAPLPMGTERCSPAELDGIGKSIPPNSLVRARLVTALNSGTSRKGAPVEAVISQPLFSKNRKLILPEGTKLEGEVTQVRPARRLSRNGKLRFDFLRMDLPKSLEQKHAETERVDAGIRGVDVPWTSHVKLDSEGGARAVAPKTRFIMPALEVMLATSSFDTDSRARSLQENSTGDAGAAAGGAVRGAVGFGLVGTVVGLIARSQPVSAAFAFYGAAWSIYSHVLARGNNVTFPADTPMQIQLGIHNDPKTKKSKPASAAGQTKS